MAHDEQRLFEPWCQRVGLETPALRRLHRGAGSANEPELARSRGLVKLDGRTKLVFTRCEPDDRRSAWRGVCERGRQVRVA